MAIFIAIIDYLRSRKEIRAIIQGNIPKESTTYSKLKDDLTFEFSFMILLGGAWIILNLVFSLSSIFIIILPVIILGLILVLKYVLIKNYK